MNHYGKPYDLTPEMRKLLSQEESFWLVVTGNSMAPTINDLRDRVYISPFNGKPQKGDILLTETTCNHCLLHRVFKPDGTMVYYKGDALHYCEGPFPIANVIGIVTKFERNGKTITVNSFYNKFFLTTLRKTITLKRFPRRVIHKIKRIREQFKSEL